MKAIMMSIRPEWVAKILNGEKTIEIRKKFPKDYVGWVYIYCTKENKTNKWAKRNTLCSDVYNGKPSGHYQLWLKDIDDGLHTILNGKVVGRFWCDKVEEYVNGAKIVCGQPAYLNTYKFILKETCLTEDELYDYCEDLSFKAIHITNLEVFDKPKEISEFSIKVFPHRKDNLMTRYLTRAPQSWCYVEV